MRELVGIEALVAIRPLVVHKEHVIEAEALLVHIQEPHGHATGPNHQADELRTTHQRGVRDMSQRLAYQIHLDEELPICQPVSVCVARLALHEI